MGWLSRRFGAAPDPGRDTGDLEEWTGYIDREVRAVCEAKGWGSQIRRRWSAREKPVSQSPIEDYEWKLLPDARGRLEEASSSDVDGTYYVLSFDRPRRRFVLQHDTHHVSAWGPEHERSTHTVITPPPDPFRARPRRGTGSGSELPPAGWLRDHLLALVAEKAPNEFSVT